MGCLVLHYPCGICGNAFAASAVPADDHLVVIAVTHCIGFQFEFPHAVGFRLQGIFLQLFPLGKVTDKSDPGCIRSPFAEHPAAVSLTM